MIWKARRVAMGDDFVVTRDDVEQAYLMSTRDQTGAYWFVPVGQPLESVRLGDANAGKSRAEYMFGIDIPW
jgi:hypothetical protein